jgi:Tol biopolymer transport system component
MQQWISGGKRVAYHELRDGRWIVVSVDIESGKQTILAEDRLLGFGAVDSDVVPIYGRHWNPGEYRDLQLLNVATGSVSTALTNQSVRQAYPDFMSQNFGDRPTSIFFPVMSYDGQRVFFKMSAVQSGKMDSPDASTREGLFVYDLKQQKFVGQRAKWGHPSWRFDGKAIVDVQSQWWDLETNENHQIPGLPHFSGSHPSMSRDGRLFVTDAHKFDGKETEWGVAVADVNGGRYAIIARFSMAGGNQSWRKTHPHPVFSRDGRRIYYNGQADKWNQLFVAEIGQP